MLLEAIDFLAREVFVDKAIEGLARRADRMSPGAGGYQFVSNSNTDYRPFVGSTAWVQNRILHI